MTEIPGPYRTPHGLDAGLRRQLLARSNAVLATINPDGSPHLTELLFYLDEADRILLPTPYTTKKVKNVLARPTVTVFVSVESGWASCTGTARVITGDEAARLNQLNRERVLTEAGMATMGLLLAAYEDTAIEITPERWISWNDDAVLDTIVSLGGDIETHPPSTWWKDLGAED
ncbi:MAG TPA: pyridoxamine 5'-phosphate oxidase family protein [Acidimicrobiia bacterium]|nr:pyridoxamine 5'-phosphate oxidase family protein [Acidimicrobiia bacterium]